MNEERIEWAVQWFPPDGPDARKTYVEESTARARFDAQKEQGTAPILLRRTIVVSDWETVENSVDGLV